MEIPENYTEEEVMTIIGIVARGLAKKFQFGQHDIDDMKQFASLFAIDGLKRYNKELGNLQTFLWTHTRNRLLNLRRDTYERQDKPCLKCPLFAYDPGCAKSVSQCTEYEDKSNCELYHKWYLRNAKKRNIIRPITINYVDDEGEDNMSTEENIDDAIDYKLVVDIVNKHISSTLRPLWIKLQNDIPIHKSDRIKLLNAVHSILEERGFDVS